MRKRQTSNARCPPLTLPHPFAGPHFPLPKVAAIRLIDEMIKTKIPARTTDTA